MAESASTGPVGYVAVRALGNSDVRIALPFHRPPVFTGRVFQVASADRFTIQNSPGWTPNAFVHQPGSQSNTYYVRFEEGALAGMIHKVLSNDGDSLQVATEGEAGLSLLTAGTRFRIIPYWTFGTLFPGGEGVTPSGSHGSPNTQILLYDAAQPGSNLAASQTYYYYAGSNPGWRRVGGGLSTVRNDDILLPHQSLIYRENTPADRTLHLNGQVQMSTVRTPVSTVQANVTQDNAIGFTVAMPFTLAQSGLHQSGAVLGSTSHGSTVDQLLVFDNAASGKNKSAIATYYYYTTSNPGWRKVGGGLNTNRDDDVVFQPGYGYVIRKRAVSPPATVSSAMIPPYVN